LIQNSSKIINGWLNTANRLQSPNFDNRPDNIKISLLVIHAISLPPGVFQGKNVLDFFQNKLNTQSHPYFQKIANVKVSAHFFIRRRGTLYQFVSCEDRAWHAGFSNFHGRNNCNDFSIGIELEGCNDYHFSDSQYQKLNLLINILKQNYPIKNIVGHSDIAPKRKTDPGANFNWNKVVL